MSKYKVVKVKEVSEQIRGVSYTPSDSRDKFEDGYVPILRAHNIQENGLNDYNLVYVNSSKVNIRQYIKKGDIVICASSGSKALVGKAAQVKGTKRFSFGAFCKVIRPKGIHPEFLGYFFQSNRYRNEIGSLSSGTNINNIKNEHLNELSLSFPSIDEQKRIAAKLDAVSELIRLRKRQLEELDLLVKSRFVEMFGDLKTNPMQFEIKDFPTFASIDGNMTTEFKKWAEYPHIGIDSIEKDTGALIGYRTVSEDGVISGKYVFTPDHIIYSKIRPNLNKVALPTFTGLCSADAYPILPNKKNCNRTFLAMVMRSDYFLDYVLPFSARTNMPKVNRTAIVSFQMPLPPISLQNEFSTYVEQNDKLKKYMQNALYEVEALQQALMHICYCE